MNPTCYRHNARNCSMCSAEPLADWERELLSRLHNVSRPEGQGDVTFVRLDGHKVTLKDVRVDSIGPGAENNGVIGVEFFDSDRVVHVPFVASWEVSY